MRAAALCLVGSASIALASASSATAAPRDFNFTFSYSGQSVSGRLVGLDLDANGNAAEADPVQVLLFHVPAIVGLNATPQNPYVFVPQTFERSTLFQGTLISTTPGVYGFHVTNDAITPATQNLLMIDAGADVTLVFNFGASLGGEGGVATYGIQAEEDALWPAINTFISYTLVPLPCPADLNGDGAVNAADLALLLGAWGPATTGAPADLNGDGGVNAADLALMLGAWGPCV